MKEAAWTQPKTVVQIEFLEWTIGDRLRYAKFVGLRNDKITRSVMKEQLANLSAVAFQNEYVKGIDALGGFPTCEFLLEGASDRIFRFVRLGIPAIPAPPRTVILLV